MLKTPKSFSKSVLKRFYSQIYSDHHIDKTNWDIIIAGGGLIGTAVACSLAKSPILKSQKVLLLEACSKKEISPLSLDSPYSNRVVSINPATRKVLEGIGAWKFVQESRFQTVKKLKVWDACSDASITFEDDFTDISYIVENNLILYSLQKSLPDHVTVHFNSKIQNVCLPEKDGDRVSVKIDNGPTATCKLLIGAEGWNSIARKTIDGDSISWNYDQTAVVATLMHSEKNPNEVAWQRFLPTGPIALLPLKSDMSSLVWSTTNHEAKKLLDASEDYFVDAVNDALWKKFDKDLIVTSSLDRLYRLLEKLPVSRNCDADDFPNVQRIVPGSRAAFPLGFGHSANYVSKGCAIIGDAAHRVHPLAGQGLNLGFGDIHELTAVLEESLSTGQILGSLASIKDYEKRRLIYNVPTMFAIDGLHRLYTTEMAPFVLLRSLGLQIIDYLPPVKKAIIRHASG